LARLTLAMGAALLLALPQARAQLSIEITGAGAQRIPIAIVPFAGEAALGSAISGIVRADLERSGLFRGLEVPPLRRSTTPSGARGSPTRW
jgi:TolB protein